MNDCLYSGEQEKCPKYEAKTDRPGFVNLTCLYWREGYLDKTTGICDAPPKKEGENENIG